MNSVSDIAGALESVAGRLPHGDPVQWALLGLVRDLTEHEPTPAAVGAWLWHHPRRVRGAAEHDSRACACARKVGLVAAHELAAGSPAPGAPSIAAMVTAAAHGSTALARLVFGVRDGAKPRAPSSKGKGRRPAHARPLSATLGAVASAHGAPSNGQ